MVLPDVKSYLSTRGLPFKDFLLLDNAPGHPQDLQHENVHIIYQANILVDFRTNEG